MPSSPTRDEKGRQLVVVVVVVVVLWVMVAAGSRALPTGVKRAARPLKGLASPSDWCYCYCCYFCGYSWLIYLRWTGAVAAAVTTFDKFWQLLIAMKVRLLMFNLFYYLNPVLLFLLITRSVLRVFFIFIWLQLMN